MFFLPARSTKLASHGRVTRWRQVMAVVAVTALTMLGTFVGPSVSTTLAADTPPMLAGRPITGSGSGATTPPGWCQGTFYGRVAGQPEPVLFTAAHCLSNGNYITYIDADGNPHALGRVSTTSSSILGVGGDIEYIVLNHDMIPYGHLNEVYNGTSNPWLITHQPTLTCANAAAAIGAGVVDDFQASAASETPYRSGTFTDAVALGWTDDSGACLRTTTVPWSGVVLGDSGSSLLLAADPHAVVGVATRQAVDPQFLGNSDYAQVQDQGYPTNPQGNPAGLYLQGGDVLAFSLVAEALPALGGLECVNPDCTFPLDAGSPTMQSGSSTIHGVGTTLYYNPVAAAGNSFTVSLAAADGATPPSGTFATSSVAFPAIASLGDGATTGPMTANAPPYKTGAGVYTFGSDPTVSGSQDIIVTDVAGKTATTSFTLTPDTSAPIAPTLTLSAGSSDVGQFADSVTVTASGSTDADSGLGSVRLG